jgi:hypothetical protein
VQPGGPAAQAGERHVGASLEEGPRSTRITPCSAKVFFSAGMILGSKIDNDFKTDIAGGEEIFFTIHTSDLSMYTYVS